MASYCIRIVFGGVLLCALLGPALAQQYKWVDKDGRTHYSDREPEGNRGKAAVIPTPSSGGASEPVDWTAKDTEFRRRQIEQKQRAAPSPEKENACAAARQRAAFWTSAEGHAAYWVNRDGEHVYYTDEERAARKQETQQAIRDTCSS